MLDEGYDEKYLNEEDKAKLRWFDWCLEMGVENFFDNIEDIFPEDSFLGKILSMEVPVDKRSVWRYESSWYKEDDGSAQLIDHEVVTYADLLRMVCFEHIDSERESLVTSLINGMDEKDYQKNVIEADKNRTDNEGSC